MLNSQIQPTNGQPSVDVELLQNLGLSEWSGQWRVEFENLPCSEPQFTSNVAGSLISLVCIFGLCLSRVNINDW